jgi:hypothetical protein
VDTAADRKPDDKAPVEYPPEFQERLTRRLAAVNEALDETKRLARLMVESLGAIRLIGYGLLLLVLIDLGTLAIGAQPMNAQWEWATLLQLVERGTVVLVALGFVFLGGSSERANKEHWILRPLYWMTLLFGLVYLAMIPLGVNNALRLQADLADRFQAAQEREDVRVDRQMNRIDRAGGRATAEQVTPEQLESLKQRTKRASTVRKSQARNAHEAQKQTLLRQAVRRLSACLVLGILFIWLWRRARWTDYYKYWF